MGFGSLMDIDKLIRSSSRKCWKMGFGSLMDIDKLIRTRSGKHFCYCFGSLMDIDKLIPAITLRRSYACFGSLMDIDKLIRWLCVPCSACRFGSLMDIDKLIEKQLPCRLARELLFISSFLETACGAGEGDDVADVGNARQIHNQALEAKAEACVLDAAEATQIEEPLVVLTV